MNNVFRKEPDAEKPHVRNSVRDTFGNGCIYSTADQIREMEEKIMLNNKEDMSKLESFMKVLTGRFDNKEQYARMQKAGKLYPYAEHVNTVCNDKIKNLPADFQGKFLVEESYYETDGKKHASAHLFLFTEEELSLIHI